MIVGFPTRLTHELPAASVSHTLTTPFAGNIAWMSALLEAPKSNVTAVSPAAMLVSRTRGVNEAPFSRSSAWPPVASPAMIVATAVRLVCVVLSIPGTIVPSAGTSVTAVGGVGPRLSTVNQPPRTVDTLPAPSTATMSYKPSAMPAGTVTVYGVSAAAPSFARNACPPMIAASI